MGEPSIFEHDYTESLVTRFAKRMRSRPTRAERCLVEILNSLNHGVLKGRFSEQYAVSGKWIIDIFFAEIRLGIEIDGSAHDGPKQRARDRAKERDCERFDVTLIRVRNSEVFGNRERLVQKLRGGWRAALDRKNRIIGTSPSG